MMVTEMLRTGFVCLLFFVCLVSSVVDEGGPSYRLVRADELRDHPGYCFDSNRCALRNEGETWTIDATCEGATCQLTSNGTLVEKRTRCAHISPVLNEDCYIVRVEGKPFPDCCPRLFCDEKIKSFFLK